ncbi:MAG: hypothetical protein JSW15_08980, partial [Deltaproteobacteria bacterium]
MDLLFLGIYGGSHGAGTGTPFSYMLLSLFRQTFLEGAVTRNIPIPASFITGVATIIFAIGKAIMYSLGIALFGGTSIGSYIGVHYSDKIGNVWTKG